MGNGYAKISDQLPIPQQICRTWDHAARPWGTVMSLTNVTALLHTSDAQMPTLWAQPKNTNKHATTYNVWELRICLIA